MLVKLLSFKNFFTQFFLIVLFLLCFFLQHPIYQLDWLGGLSVTIYLITIGLMLFGIYHSPIVHKNAVVVWVLLIWAFVFGAKAQDYHISGSLFFLSLVIFNVFLYERQLSTDFEAFDTAMYLGFAAILYPPIIFLSVSVFLYFWITRSFFQMSLLLYLLGFVIFFLVFFQVVYLIDALDPVLEYYQSQFCIQPIEYSFKLFYLLPILLLVLIAWIDHFLNAHKQASDKKQSYFLYLLFFTNILIFLALFIGDNYTLMCFLTLCISVFIARYIQYRKYNWWKEIILWTYTICLIAFYWYDTFPYIYSLFREVTFW